MAWYNKYRPTSFEDVVGQQLTKEILQKSLDKGAIKHAYLFSGPKGIGKTTLARIFASKLNYTEENPEALLDIIEMDAASNTGIDDIRQLIESSKSAPISAPYKIYIIDEVHMLSKSAMNALLKILEEPPEYIIFLLATTNPEKLIPTVLSRLTKLPLYGHTPADIKERLNYIASQEQVSFDDGALEVISKHAGGSQRDAINLLETAAAYNLDQYTSENVSEILGLLPNELLTQIAGSLLSGLDKELLQKLAVYTLEPNIMLSQLMELAIDKSFEGDTSFEPLIVPVAETLSLNLPFNSMVSAIAVVSQKMSTGTQVTTHQSSSTPSPAPAPTKPSSPSAPQEPTKPVATAPVQEKSSPKHSAPVADIKPQETPPAPQPNREVPQTVELNPPVANTNTQPAPQIEQPKVVESNVSASSLEATILAYKNETDCPPILKMIFPDLRVGDGEGNTLEFSVTNGIFLAQIQSSKMQSWILDKLEKQIGTRYTINVSQRQKSTQAPVPDQPSQPAPANPHTTTFADLSREPQPQHSEPATPEETKLTTKETKGKIFYKVFKALPKEMNEGDLPVYAGPIPSPEKKNDEWSEVEDMFELE